jgi:hypothetical protein
MSEMVERVAKALAPKGWAQARYHEEMKRLEERSLTQCEHCGKMTRISRAKAKTSHSGT